MSMKRYRSEEEGSMHAQATLKEKKKAKFSLETRASVGFQDRKGGVIRDGSELDKSSTKSKERS